MTHFRFTVDTVKHIRCHEPMTRTSALVALLAVFILMIIMVIYLQWAGTASLQQHRDVWPWTAPPATGQHCS